jgi:V/A-type H+/Na+-transporting ATPase subunit E
MPSERLWASGSEPGKGVSVEVHKGGEELERQVMEEARRKAARIRQNAEAELGRARQEEERKLTAERARLAGERDAHVRALRERLEAALPLDLMRVRLSYVESAIREEMSAMIASLGDREAEQAIGAALSRAAASFAGKSIIVTAVGIPEKEAEAVARAALPSAVVGRVRSASPEAGAAAGASRGVLIESEDGRTRFRGTLAELQAEILEERRQALAEALFGREALEAMSVEST